MRLAGTIGFLLMAAVSSRAATVVVDLGADDPAIKQRYGLLEPGALEIKLINAFPNRRYEIVDRDLRRTAEPRFPEGLIAAPKACEANDGQVQRILDAARELSKGPLTKSRIAGKPSEADIRTVLNGNLRCTAADQATLSMLRERFSITLDGFTLEPGETKTFEVVSEDTTWTVIVSTEDIVAAERARIHDEFRALDRLLGPTILATTDPFSAACTYSDGNCTERVYVNGDRISTVTITDIPRGAVTIVVTGGEYFPCQAAGYNFATYEDAPETLIVPLHMNRGFLGIVGPSLAKGEAAAAALYGLDRCPKTGRTLRKSARDAYPTTSGPTSVDFPDPRTRPVKAESIASLPLFLRGKSSLVAVQFMWADGAALTTFVVPVVYQRFSLSAGGLVAVARLSDQSIDTETIAGQNGQPEKQLVRAIRREAAVAPATGIVMNLHPGNLPAFAFQLGVAANRARRPSYYGGIALRAREFTTRFMVTLGLGLALQQEQQFPFLRSGETYLSTSPLLKPTAKYRAAFPYVAIGFVFNFGGLSERTNVADSVTNGH